MEEKGLAAHGWQKFLSKAERLHTRTYPMGKNALTNLLLIRIIVATFALCKREA